MEKLKETQKKREGITLISLVVTIVILLILAGITISQLTESGLFENAKLAEQKSKEAQEKEDETLSDYENKIGQYVDGTRDGEYVTREEYNALLTVVEQLQTNSVTIEKGSNDNGNYYKFSDGTLICTKTVSGTIDITGTTGNVYNSTSTINFGNVAYNFIETPVVTRTISGSNASIWLGDGWSASSSSFGYCRIYRGVSTPNTTYKIDLIAIGKWK